MDSRVSGRFDDCIGKRHVEWMSLVATPCAARTAGAAAYSCALIGRVQFLSR
jgi:hypothetical protein